MWKKLGLGGAMLLALCGVSIEGLAIDETTFPQNSNSSMTAINANSGASVTKKKHTRRRRARRGRRGRRGR